MPNRRSVRTRAIPSTGIFRRRTLEHEIKSISLQSTLKNANYGQTNLRRDRDWNRRWRWYGDQDAVRGRIESVRAQCGSQARSGEGFSLPPHAMGYEIPRT